jgi:hypothetical protein
MSSRKRKLRRRVRARMEKTGESYQAAHRNLSKGRSQKTDALQPEQSTEPLSKERSSTPRFALAIHRALAAKSSLQPASLTPEENAARRARLWSRLGRELSRIASPREASRFLETVKKKDLDAEQLEQLARNFATLPTGFMRQLELAAQQLRQLQPMLEHTAAIRDMARQAEALLSLTASVPPTIMEAARDLLPVLDATQRALEDLHAAQKIPAELAASAIPETLATARRLLAEVPAQRLAQNDVVSAALSHLEAGPVAAAMQYINEGPVAAAMRVINNDPVTAAMRFVNNSPMAVARNAFRRGTA